MGDVISLIGRGARNVAPLAGSNSWRLIGIDKDDAGAFAVRAWTGHPGDPVSDYMTVGFGASLLEASEVARTKAHELGVREIVDFTSARAEDPPETAA